MSKGSKTENWSAVRTLLGEWRWIGKGKGRGSEGVRGWAINSVTMVEFRHIGERCGIEIFCSWNPTINTIGNHGA